MESIDIEKDLGGKIIQNAAKKVSKYYVPPIATVEDVDFNGVIDITTYEEIANVSYIHPKAEIFYELNCSERMLRELSISIQDKGKNSSFDKPSNWHYISPEGNGATLLKILCLVH
jgi:hypothetical protein